jgi:hypothetical protein
MGTGDLEGRTRRTTKINRAGGMVLHPLTQVRIGMLVSIRVSGRKLVMNVLGDGKWSERQQQRDEADGQPL